MSKVVSVACRLPHGMVIEVGEPGSDRYRSIRLNGPLSKNADGKPSSLVVNGYAFTKVAEDVWKEFADKHRGAMYLVNRMVYAEDSFEKAQNDTKLAESKGKTGFEPIDPDKQVPGIETDREHYKRAQLSVPSSAA